MKQSTRFGPIQPSYIFYFASLLAMTAIHVHSASAQNAPTTQPAARPTPSAKVVQLTPPMVSFGRMVADMVETRTVTIANSGPGSMKATLQAPPNAVFRYELIETVPGKESQLFVTAAGPLKAGVVRETAVIRTGLTEEPTVQVTAAAYVLDALEITPTVVIVPSRAEGKSITRRVVQLINRGPESMKLASASCDDPAIKITTSETLSNRLFRVVLEFPSGYSPPSEGRVVTVQTVPSRQPAITIPIRSTSGSPKPNTTAGKSTPARRPAMEMADKPTPDFKLSTIVGGRDISKAEIGMAPATVLNFVAPNCGFCKRQIPKVETVRSRFEPMGVRFVNVSETMQKAFTQQEAEGVFDSLGSKLEIAMDPGNKIGGMFKVSSFPTMFVVSHDGIIRHVNIGAKANIDEMLTTQLNELLDGKHEGDGKTPEQKPTPPATGEPNKTAP